MSEYHAIASPSSAHRWMNCVNSLAMEKDQPEGDTKAADLGTDKHELMSLCLEFGKNAIEYDGHVLKKGHAVNKEFAHDVQTVIDNVRDRIRNYESLGCSVVMELEQDLPIGHVTGEDGATGRCDVLLVVSRPDGVSELDVVDAKFGYQEVEAFENAQLSMYAAGALRKYALTEEFKRINLAIEQPLRTGNEWSTTPAQIAEFELFAGMQSKKALAIRDDPALMTEDGFSPSEKTCMWCKAKAVCPALLKKVEEAVAQDFEFIEHHGPVKVEMIPIEQLAEKFSALEMIEDWINAVRGRIEAEVLAGKRIPGVKVVMGKKGNRTWSSSDEAEAMLKKFRLKQEEMYSMKLLGPKPILDLMKTQPRRLKQIEALVVQPEGKPHVVVDSDPRPAIEIKPADDGFVVENDLC